MMSAALQTQQERIKQLELALKIAIANCRGCLRNHHGVKGDPPWLADLVAVLSPSPTKTGDAE